MWNSDSVLCIWSIYANFFVHEIHSRIIGSLTLSDTMKSFEVTMPCPDV